MNVAVVVSHPIQHFCPGYRSWSAIAGINLKVFFISPMGSVPYIDEAFGKEVKWDNLYLSHFTHSFITDKPIPADPKKQYPGLVEAVLDFQPQLLISYGYAQKFQQETVNACKQKGIAVAYISDSENRKSNWNFKDFLRHKYLKNYFKKIDFFLSVGDANEAYYLSHKIEPAAVLRMPFPIDIYSFENKYNNRQQLRTEFRKKWNINFNSFVCIMVGKLLQSKFQDHLIEAAKRFPNEDVCFLLVGSGPEEQQFRAQAKGVAAKVIFTGFLKPEEIIDAYAAADVYVHTSKKERHSLSISEAIYVGLPAIVSDTIGSYGCNDDVRPGINGFVYEWGNIDELEKRIRLLASDKELFEKFANNSRRIGLYNQQIAHSDGMQTLKTLVEIEG